MRLLFELGANLVKYRDDAATVLRSIVRELCRYNSHRFHTYGGTNIIEMLEDFRDAEGQQWLSICEEYDIGLWDDSRSIQMWDPRHGDDSEGR